MPPPPPPGPPRLISEDKNKPRPPPPNKDLQLRPDDPAVLLGGDLRGEVFLYIARRNNLLGSLWKQYEAVMVGTTLQLHDPGTLNPDMRHLYDEYPKPAKTIALPATETKELPKAKMRKLQGDKKWVFMIEDQIEGKAPPVFAVRRQVARDAWIQALTERGANKPEADFVYAHEVESPIPRTIRDLLSGLFDTIAARRKLPGVILTADVFALVAHLGHQTTPEEREKMAGGKEEFSKLDLMKWWEETIPLPETPATQVGWDDSSLPSTAAPQPSEDDPNAATEPPATGRVDTLISRISANTENWNDIHQKVLDLSAGRYRSTMLHKFLNAFVRVAIAGLRQIVRELPLPDHDKTLMYLPQRSGDFELTDLGRTYIRSGLIFRVADGGEEQLSPNDNQVLSKLMTIDWQGSSAVRNASGAYFFRPVLSCVIEYLGIRAFVSTIAPLDDGNVVFDGTNTSRLRLASGSPVKTAVEKLDLSELNLQLEAYGSGDRPLELIPETGSASFLLPLQNQEPETPAPGTLKSSLCRSLVVHTDGGRWHYITPTVSVLPPEVPASGSTQESLVHQLTHRLRAELVINYVPKQERLERDAKMPPDDEISSATAERVIREQITGLAVALDKLVVFVYDSSSLTAAMHKFGLNMRHLGRLYTECSAPHMRALILNECIARVCKNLHRQLLRRVLFSGAYSGRSSQQDNATVASVDFVNTVLGQSDASEALWTDVLPQKIMERYGQAVASTMRRFQVHMPQLLEALQCRCSMDIHATQETRYDVPQPISVGQLVLRMKMKDLSSFRGENVQAATHEHARSGRYAQAIAVLERGQDDDDTLLAETDLFDRRVRAINLFKVAQAMEQAEQLPLALQTASTAMVALPELSALAVRIGLFMARLHMQRKDYESALDACGKAHDKCLWVCGEHHVLMLHTLAAAADARYAQALSLAALVHGGTQLGLEEQKEAARLADEALAGATKLLGIQHPLTVALAYKAAVIKVDMDEIQTARHIIESVEAAVRARPPDQVGANCLQLLASTYARQLQLPKAYSLAQDSLVMKLKLDTTQKHELASCFRANAVIAQKMLGYEGAALLHTESVDVLEPPETTIRNPTSPPQPKNLRKKPPAAAPAPWSSPS